MSEVLSTQTKQDSAYSSRQTSQNDGGFSFVIEDSGDVEKSDEGSTASSQDSALGWKSLDVGEKLASQEEGSIPGRVSRPS